MGYHSAQENCTGIVLKVENMKVTFFDFVQ